MRHKGARKRGFFSSGMILDLDGTVYRGEEIIPGAREMIEGLRRRAHPLLTNGIALDTHN